MAKIDYPRKIAETEGKIALLKMKLASYRKEYKKELKRIECQEAVRTRAVLETVAEKLNMPTEEMLKVLQEKLLGDD